MHAAEQARPSRASSSAPRSDLELGQVLAADVDEDVLRADRVRRDQAALDQPVRDAQHDLAVLERARLGLVRVDGQVARLPRVRRDEARLAARREERRRRGRAGSTRAARRSTACGSIAARLRELLVAAGLAVVGELRQVALVGACEDELRRGRSSARAQASAQLRRRSPGTSSALHRLAVAVVDGDDRAPAAAARALDRAQRDLAVLRRLAGVDPELALERLEHLLRADERAGDVGADLDQCAARPARGGTCRRRTRPTCSTRASGRARRATSRTPRGGSQP